MEEIIIKAKTRDVIGKKVKVLRREGELPAVIYGRTFEPRAISLDYREVSHSLPYISTAQLITVEVDGKPHTSLVRDRQFHPVTGTILHVDFLEVSMTELLRTSVSIILDGEAPAVREFNGVLVTGQEALDIECLPADLPDEVVVDISVLNEIGDAIYVRDVHLSDKVEVLTSPDEMIALVTTPSAEPVEEEEEEEFEAELEEPEIIEKGKKEEEEIEEAE